MGFFIYHLLLINILIIVLSLSFLFFDYFNLIIFLDDRFVNVLILLSPWKSWISLLTICLLIFIFQFLYEKDKEKFNVVKLKIFVWTFFGSIYYLSSSLSGLMVLYFNFYIQVFYVLDLLLMMVCLVLGHQIYRKFGFTKF